MRFKPKKIVWSVIAVCCVLGLAYVWFVGLPVPDYVATDDGLSSKTYTIQVAPYTFYDINMSSAEKLVRTDWETYYDFENAGIAKTSTQLKADIINGDKGIYGRPGSFVYRVFDNCTIQVESDTSMMQPLTSFEKNEIYTVNGYYEDLKPSKKKLPAVLAADDDFLVPFGNGIYGAYLRSYSYDSNVGSLLYLDDECNFYSVKTVYGVQYDVINQLLATAKACYGLNITEYWAGENFVLFQANGWTLGVRYINRNTQRVVVCNNTFSEAPALRTIIAG